MKKYIVLGVLFILPITAYLFFSSGVNNFEKLPIQTENIPEISGFTTLGIEEVKFINNITILGFLGNDLKKSLPNVFNLTHKIYRPYHKFDDFHFIMVVPNGNKGLVEELLIELEKIENTKKWKFIFGEPEMIKELFDSLKTKNELNQNYGSSKVYIVDKNKNLRGREDDGEILYGYETSTIADLKHTLEEDIKVLFEEYREEYRREIRKDKRKI